MLIAAPFDGRTTISFQPARPAKFVSVNEITVAPLRPSGTRAPYTMASRVVSRPPCPGKS